MSTYPGPPVSEPAPPQSPFAVPQPARRRRRWPLLVGLAVVLVFVACLGTLAILGTLGAKSTDKRPEPGNVAAPVAPATTAAKAPATSTKPVVSIEDGTWTVGVDMPAGRYRTTTNVANGCYWAITKTGSNGQDIVANDLPAGGRPSVTLKAGQDFETRDCGKWSKVG